MALHSTGSGINRDGDIKPNTHDLRGIDTPRMAHGTVSINPQTDATTNTGRISTKNQQVIANDGTTNKALLGYQQGLGKWGLFVTQDGTDVTTNTDLSKFLLNSNQDAFKIVQSGTFTTPSVTATPGGAGQWAQNSASSVVVTHNLGYIPAIMAFISSGATYTPLPYTQNDVQSSTSPFIVTTFPTVDATFLTITVRVLTLTTAKTAGGDTIKYYLLQETAN